MGGASLLPIIASLAVQSGAAAAEPLDVEQASVEARVQADDMGIPPLDQPKGKWDRREDRLDTLTPPPPLPPPPPPENWRDTVTDPLLIEILEGRRRNISSVSKINCRCRIAGD